MSDSRPITDHSDGVPHSVRAGGGREEGPTLQVTTTDRGFHRILHPIYGDPQYGSSRLIQESSIVGKYDDAFDRPGSSALWIGNDHHLNREEVAELRDLLSHWLNSGSLHTHSQSQQGGV